MFNEYPEAISDFRITLDGPSEIHNARRPYRTGKGSFDDAVSSIDLLLENKHTVKMQTIIGAGNIQHLDELFSFAKDKNWFVKDNFQWRIEGSHDYANLDKEKDEISEGKMVQKLISLWENHAEVRGKLKFESFKYLGHITRSFGWLGEYKTYWGPKFAFCEPQKGFHYVFSTDGQIYHCPRTVNDHDFCLGEAKEGFSEKESELKHKTILDKEPCLPCSINTLCGGGCIVQKKYYPDLNCKEYAMSVMSEFIDLMKYKVLEKADAEKIVSINDIWLS